VSYLQDPFPSPTPLPSGFKPFVVTDGRFRATKDFHESAMSEIAALERLLEEPDLKAGTMEGRTAAAVIGARRRAVHVDYADNLDQEPGSIVKIGLADEALLDLRLCGLTAPRMDVEDPLRGLRTAVAVAKTLMDGARTAFQIGLGDRYHAMEEIWTDAAGLIVCDLIAHGHVWKSGSNVEVHYPTPLAPFSVSLSEPGFGSRSATGDLSHLVSATNPARRVPGRVTLGCCVNGEGMTLVTLKSSPFEPERNTIVMPDAMERLRRTLALKRLLA
jgi:hypothetical protein